MSLPELSDIGKVLVIAGVLLVIIGAVFSFGGKIPYIGKLPGDFFFERDGLSVYVPLATSIILSIVFTVLINLFLKK
jgi:hypothetical protein